MNILITGGSGFIGSHLAKELLKKGHRVCAMDNLSTGNLSNIKHLHEHPQFSFVPGSILDESLMRELIDESDMIYHLAAAVGGTWDDLQPDDAARFRRAARRSTSESGRAPW